MENNANLTDGARQADTVSSEHAETMFSADQAETNMVKLVDGKLVSIGDTESDVSDDMPRIRLGSDEERALEGDDKKKYENSASALRAGNEFAPDAMPDNPIAVADITGNPDAGATVNTGLPSEDEPDDSTKTNSFGDWQFIGNGQPSGDMIPPTPGTPDPTQPVPGIPETPPTPPAPGPEIPDLPGTPRPASPEIPDMPDTPKPAIPDIQNSSDTVTYTSAAPGVVPTNGPKPDDDVPYTRYENLDQGAKADPGSEEGMEDKPNTGDSARPYDVNAKDTSENQPGERPEEAREAQKIPREMADESSIEAQDMISGPDRSDQKSTEGLDRKYNDPEAAREMAS
ncbi:hypothetical protein [Spirosoma sp. KNUC1025]|uniref:hypothetical protein n=1 Tax=Spirosoma sp. KNUC1025 TaxID=2894082 RepID=UPI00386CE3F0|nr:hypothetical protein LN737_28545 [Spirosoma sp. KNUC1025]